MATIKKRMILRAAAIALMLLMATTAWADANGSCGENVTYSFVKSTGTLTISGSGAMADYDVDNGKFAPWDDVKFDIKTVVIESGVTSIGDMAFHNCRILTSVTIPSSVTSIGVWAFVGCEALTSVIIPASVTSIEFGAFLGCTALTSVFILTQSLTCCGQFAFSDNADGRKIYALKGSAESYQISWNDYENDIVEFTASGNCGQTGTDGSDVKWVLGDNGTIVIYGSGDMMNYVTDSDAPWNDYKSSIKTVVIENGVTSIGKNAFYLCQGLTSVTIPYGVTDIFSKAFYICDKLASVTIPSSVMTIDDCAFFNTSLTSVNIPASVSLLGKDVFSSCSALESITVDKDNKKYDSRDGCNAIIEKNGNTLILGCKNTVIPDGVTSIGNNAFDGCTGLTSITIPSSVTSIGQWAFLNCKGLTSIIINYGVTSIGQCAFGNCTGLTSVTIPASVTSIGDDAFMGCIGVSDVYCFANPDNLTWGGSNSDFILDDDDPTLKTTVCHVAGSKLATFVSNFSNVNVTFMGDGIEPGNQAYLAGMTTYKSGTPTEGVKAFLPVSYDLNTATVELAEVKGAPKNLPVIYGSAKDGEALPALFFLKYVADDSDDAKAIQSDYDSQAGKMSERFVITDGEKTLSKVIEQTGVDASEAVILVLTNGKFTTVDFSAADLEKKAQAGLLLFVLTKWEYMHIQPAAQSAAAPLGARTIAIGEGNTTGIEQMYNVRNQMSDVWYDLQGRKLNGEPTKKGIYIYNGIKVKK